MSSQQARIAVVSEYRIPYWEPDGDERHRYIHVRRGPADLSDFWAVIDGDFAWGPNGFSLSLRGDMRFRYLEDEAIDIAETQAYALNAHVIRDMENRFPGFQYRGGKYDMNRNRKREDRVPEQNAADENI